VGLFLDGIEARVADGAFLGHHLLVLEHRPEISMAFPAAWHGSPAC
jgi:hypothetical protein